MSVNFSHSLELWRNRLRSRGGGGGGGANTKVADMYGSGGCFRDQNTKVTCILLYNKGGWWPYFIPNHKSINGTFVHTFRKKIIKNYEKMPNFHSPGDRQINKRRI